MSKYEKNVVYRANLTGHFYFAYKVKVIDDRRRLALGKKIDVTKYILPYLSKKFAKEVL